MARIELDNVSVVFRVPRHGGTTLKDLVVRDLFRGRGESAVEVRALEGVTLSVENGQRIGIIGHNGSGKSTLLKMLAGVYPPTSGRRVVEGRISSLFDISLGFEMHATGRENITYRGYLQGETPRGIRQKTDAIAEFTELGTFLDMPVRYYSTGMVVRLAFAIATAIEPEILLVDEVLAAGDLAFQEKARRRMREMMDRAQLMVMVSHDLASLAELCDRGVWMDHGHIRLAGPMDEVIAAYVKSVQKSRHDTDKPKDAASANISVSAPGPASTDNGVQPLAPAAGRVLDLRAFERRVYSRAGEDGILQEILQRVGVHSRCFTELLCHAAHAPNCTRLALDEGWHGVFFTPTPVRAAQMTQTYAKYPGVRCACARPSSANVEDLLAEHDVPEEPDVLSIVLASNDYWVWQAVRRWRPRVVVIQYNASHPPPARWVMKEDPDYEWDGTSYFGASLASLAALGRRKGYTLVATESTGVTAFFVRDDLVEDRFVDPSVYYHYSPARHGSHEGGHPPRIGPSVAA
jgi:lipopolysaccharide transport system ATP-binding protein